MENMQSRLEAQERFWKSRLKQIETEHKTEMDRLRAQLDQAKGKSEFLQLKGNQNSLVQPD